MKEITIVCPIFNEEENIKKFIKNFNEIFKNHLNYKFSILFADNASTDFSSRILKKICKENKDIKYIRYAKNNGVMKSLFNTIKHVDTDACAVFDCDLQDDPKLLNEFIKNWELEIKIIYGKRVKRKEIFLLGFLRNIFKKPLSIPFTLRPWPRVYRQVSRFVRLTLRPYGAGHGPWPNIYNYLEALRFSVFDAEIYNYLKMFRLSVIK